MGQFYVSKMAVRTPTRYLDPQGVPLTFREITRSALYGPELQQTLDGLMLLDDPTLLGPLRELEASEEWKYDPIRTARRHLDWGVHLLTASREYDKTSPRSPYAPPHEVPLRDGDDHGADDIDAMPCLVPSHYYEEQVRRAEEFYRRERLARLANTV